MAAFAFAVDATRIQKIRFLLALAAAGVLIRHFGLDQSRRTVRLLGVWSLTICSIDSEMKVVLDRLGPPNEHVAIWSIVGS